MYVFQYVCKLCDCTTPKTWKAVIKRVPGKPFQNRKAF